MKSQEEENIATKNRRLELKHEKACKTIKNSTPKINKIVTTNDKTVKSKASQKKKSLKKVIVSARCVAKNMLIYLSTIGSNVAYVIAGGMNGVLIIKQVVLYVIYVQLITKILL